MTQKVDDALGRELCARAAEMLKASGFVFAYASRQSEAAYYRLPGFDGLLRVATHGQHGRPRHVPNDEPVLARLTFSQQMRPRSHEGFERMVALAIGYYVLRSGILGGANDLALADSETSHLVQVKASKEVAAAWTREP